jgi:hypothetical protein
MNNNAKSLAKITLGYSAAFGAAKITIIFQFSLK